MNSHLILFCFFNSGSWGIVEALDTATLRWYSATQRIDLTPKSSFAGVTQFVISFQEPESQSFSCPLYSLERGDENNIVYGIDHFQRVWKISLCWEQDTWSVVQSLLASDDHWRISCICYHKGSLFVGCKDGKVFQLESSFQEVFHLNSCIKKLLSWQNTLFAIDSFDHLWLFSNQQLQRSYCMEGAQFIFQDMIVGIRESFAWAQQLDQSVQTISIAGHCQSLIPYKDGLLLLLRNGTLLVTPVVDADHIPLETSDFRKTLESLRDTASVYDQLHAEAEHLLERLQWCVKRSDQLQNTFVFHSVIYQQMD